MLIWLETNGSGRVIGCNPMLRINKHMAHPLLFVIADLNSILFDQSPLFTYNILEIGSDRRPCALSYPLACYLCFPFLAKVGKGAKIRNRYNEVPHLTQDTNWKVTDSQLDTTYESQGVSPFPAGNHKAHINSRTQRHSKHKTEKT